MNILIRTGGGRAKNKELGLGHIFRTINLASHFKTKKINFLLEDYGGAKEEIINHGFKNIFLLKKEPPLENDLKQTMEWINSRDDKDYIYNMFIKGPPENKGFMWCDKDGGRRKWWTEKESKGLKDVTQYVLNLGWDSSGYGLFMRKLQNHIINKTL